MLQTYAADIFFGQSWDDHRLKLPANMASEYRLLPVEWLGRRHSVNQSCAYLSNKFRKLFTMSIEERGPKVGFSLLKVPTISEYFKNFRDISLTALVTDQYQRFVKHFEHGH